MSENLSNLRKQIDDIDAELVKILNKRADLVLEVRRTKKQENIQTYSPAREKQILERVAELSGDGSFPKDAMRRIFVSVVSATRSLIGETKVAYLAPDRARGSLASLRQFGDDTSFCAVGSLEEMLNKLGSSEIGYGVCLVDGIDVALGLCDSSARIVAEGFLNTDLVLATSGTALSEISTVTADAESFARAESWLKQELPSVKRQLLDSSSDGVKLIKSDDSNALLAPRELVSKTNLLVVSAGIHTNRERYVVLGKDCPAPTGSDKTSVALRLPDQSGALAKVLEIFASKQISLCAIESCSETKVQDGIMFLIDFVGHVEEESVKEVIRSLEKLCSYMKILGSYPSE